MKAQFAPMVRQARKEGYAVAAINILNHLTFSAVVEAAARTRSPVIIQTSVATVKALKPANLAALARTVIDPAPVPVALHLDHCQTIEMCNLCCDLGWDSVMFDGSHLSYEENIKQTKIVRQYAQSKGVDVEGEVGVIAGVEDDISHDIASLAGFEDTIRYIRETGVDAIAPAIGTAHGVYSGTPNINFDLVKQLAGATDCPVVVHGGTGLDDATFRRLVELGASKINISTALKMVYTGSVRQYLNENEKVNPLKLDEFVTGKVIELAESLFKLFGSAGKI
jgi:fructose-bisphosphate aldolase class II